MSTSITSVPTTVYRVSYKSKYGFRRARSFLTLSVAISRCSWWWIFDKYQENGEFLPPIACACNDYPPGGEYDGGPMGTEACGLHSRRDGYYARVHARLVAYIKARIAECEASEMQT